MGKGRFVMGKRDGFTLLEVLVVVVVMMLLMAFAFRLSRVTQDAKAKSVTVARLQALSAAIEEFHAEYGQYPPATGTWSLFPRMRSSSFKTGLLKEDILQSSNYEGMFVMGLFMYLQIYNGSSITPSDDIKQIYDDELGPQGRERILRDVDQAVRDYLPSDYSKNFDDQRSSRDKKFAKRIKPFLDKAGILVAPNFSSKNPKDKPKTIREKCVYIRAADGWGEDICYECPPPYTSYILYSKGKDRKYKDDPLDMTKEENKDNIFGGVGNL